MPNVNYKDFRISMIEIVLVSFLESEQFQHTPVVVFQLNLNSYFPAELGIVSKSVLMAVL